MNQIEKICVQRHLPHEQHIVRHLKDNHHTLYAAFMKQKLWNEDDTITACFIEDREPYRTPITDIKQAAIKSNSPIDPLQYEVDNMSVKDAIKKIVKERIQPLIPMKIVWVEKPSDAFVRISFDSTGGAYSLVGTDSKYAPTNQPTMNFGWFDVATVIHEWGHVLGMIHEHQNPKGGIQWNKEKVYQWAKETQGWDRATTNRNIIQHYDQNQINGSEFDPKSIMLYFFPPNLTLNNKGTQQNLSLSNEDTQWITKIYNTPPPPPPLTKWWIILTIITIVLILIFFYTFVK